MSRWKFVLAGLFSVGFVAGGSYFLYATETSPSPTYLGGAIVASVLAILLGKAVGAYDERTALAGLTALPGIVLVSVAELTVGDGGVASVAVGTGIAGLLVLFFLQ